MEDPRTRNTERETVRKLKGTVRNLIGRPSNMKGKVGMYYFCQQIYLFIYLMYLVGVYEFDYEHP